MTARSEIAALRQAVVDEARTWLRTPYAHRQKAKGAGVDCALFPVAVYSACGLMPPNQDFGNYSTQWHVHHDEERYLEIVLRYSREVEAPQPGDFALWKICRTFSHGGIVTAWPRVIHSYVRRGVIEEDASLAAEFREKNGALRPVRFFTLWGDE